MKLAALSAATFATLTTIAFQEPRPNATCRPRRSRSDHHLEPGFACSAAASAGRLDRPMEGQRAGGMSNREYCGFGRLQVHAQIQRRRRLRSGPDRRRRHENDFFSARVLGSELVRKARRVGGGCPASARPRRLPPARAVDPDRHRHEALRPDLEIAQTLERRNGPT
jgi:hypothetical protein